MRPAVRTPAHQTDLLAEIVCSNTFKSLDLSTAHGLLKAELRLLGSLLMAVADLARIPGGTALTVDRRVFSEEVTRRVAAHPRITVHRGEVVALPSPGIVATGPLTSDRLAEVIRTRLGLESLAFYDAIAPIVSADSLDLSLLYRASRYGKGRNEQGGTNRTGGTRRNEQDGRNRAERTGRNEQGGTNRAERTGREVQDGTNRTGGTGQEGWEVGEGDYLNAPFDREEYERFVDALTSADQFAGHDFDQVPYFEGCLPVEEMARRGRETLRFGPMKPVGLPDPRTGREPYAVVQLRQEDRAGQMWNLVGFQTRLRIPEQQRVLRMIPGLAEAEFLRYGSIHRNTYLNTPGALTAHLSARDDERLLFAGQLVGVEGYTESLATGLLAGLNLARLLEGLDPLVPPPGTMLGALLRYVHQADPRHFQPMNANFGLLPPLEESVRDKRRRKERLAERALASMQAFAGAIGAPGSNGTRFAGEAYAS
jgi:methylenetetrahydrofolate--tRNA-(uracil-5-)-methyltransferase